jgi:long-chain fatty acid transport protein
MNAHPRLLAALTILGASLVADHARANPLDEFGFGTRTTAMGGAGVASSNDVSANYYNPAHLARTPGLQLDLGYKLVEPKLRINDHDLGLDTPRGFEGGVTLPGELWQHRVAASVALYLPDARLTRIRALPERQPRFEVYDNRPQRVVISTSLSLEIWEDLYVGGTLTFLSNSEGQVSLEGTVSASDPEDTEVFGAVDVAFPAVRYPSLGVLWTPGRWRVGAVFRQEFGLHLDLSLALRGDVVFGPQQAPLVEDASLFVRSQNVNLFSPRQYGLGLAYEADDWTLSADLSYLEWRHFPSPTSLLTLTLDLKTLPLEIPPLARPSAPNFHDIVIPRVGGEWWPWRGQTVSLALRGGYFYEPSPAPDQPDSQNFVDSDKHGLSAGVGLRLDGWTEVLPGPTFLDLTGLVILLPPRSYLKDDPADPVGDFTAEGEILGVSASCKFLF